MTDDDKKQVKIKRADLGLVGRVYETRTASVEDKNKKKSK